MRNLLYSTKLLNYYDDNDFYDTHTDFSVYTMVVMLCKEPKRFMGGDFHLTDIDTKIEFQHNRIVFFPSFAGHKVDTVKKIFDHTNMYGAVTLINDGFNSTINEMTLKFKSKAENYED